MFSFLKHLCCNWNKKLTKWNIIVWTLKTVSYVSTLVTTFYTFHYRFQIDDIDYMYLQQNFQQPCCSQQSFIHHARAQNDSAHYHLRLLKRILRNFWNRFYKWYRKQITQHILFTLFYCTFLYSIMIIKSQKEFVVIPLYIYITINLDDKCVTF